MFTWENENFRIITKLEKIIEWEFLWQMKRGLKMSVKGHLKVDFNLSLNLNNQCLWLSIDFCALTSESYLRSFLSC